jgi:hypothetical protein
MCHIDVKQDEVVRAGIIWLRMGTSVGLPYLFGSNPGHIFEIT